MKTFQHEETGTITTCEDKPSERWYEVSLSDDAVLRYVVDGDVLRDGEPCSHPGCLQHVSHPCDGCGRIGGFSKHS